MFQFKTNERYVELIGNVLIYLLLILLQFPSSLMYADAFESIKCFKWQYLLL